MSGRQGIQEHANICICEKHDWWAEYIGQEGSECPYCKITYYGEYCELQDKLKISQLGYNRSQRELKALKLRWRKAARALRKAELPVPPETKGR